VRSAEQNPPRSALDQGNAFSSKRASPLYRGGTHRNLPKKGSSWKKTNPVCVNSGGKSLEREIVRTTCLPPRVRQPTGKSDSGKRLPFIRKAPRGLSREGAAMPSRKPPAQKREGNVKAAERSEKGSTGGGGHLSGKNAPSRRGGGSAKIPGGDLFDPQLRLKKGEKSGREAEGYLSARGPL